MKEKILPSKKRRKTNRPKLSVFAAYGGVFILIISVITTGYQPPQPASKSTSVANAAVQTPLASPNIGTPSVDNLLATDVAASLAEQINMPVSAYVTNMSQSLAAKDELAQTNDNAIVKPQIVQPTVGSRGITSYVVKNGDTLASIASNFGLSAQTIRWANNMTGDSVSPGKKLIILPVNGVMYTVRSGDTVAKVASTYSANQNRLISYNNLELSGLKPGAKIVIPDGILPANLRPGYVAPVTNPYVSSGSYFSTVYGGNGYAFGNCTFYAYNRRVQMGLPVGSNWGNASTWALYASSAGFRVDHNPSVGAIVQWNAYASNWIGYAGHVAIVEAVNANGSIVISEMNNYAYGGFNVVDRRTMSASEVALVSNFIH